MEKNEGRKECGNEWERREGKRERWSERERRMRGTGHSSLPLVLLFTSDPSWTVIVVNKTSLPRDKYYWMMPEHKCVFVYDLVDRCTCHSATDLEVPIFFFITNVNQFCILGLKIWLDFSPPSWIIFQFKFYFLTIFFFYFLSVGVNFLDSSCIHLV